MSRWKTSPVLHEKAVSAAAARTREMVEGTYFGDIRDTIRSGSTSLMGDSPADLMGS